MGEITNQAITRKVTEACRDYIALKALEERMESHKAFFKEAAKQNKTTDFENSTGDKVKISPQTYSSIDPAKFEKLLKKLNLSNKLSDCITVKVGEAKKLVGEAHLENITESTVNPFGKVLIKPQAKGA